MKYLVVATMCHEVVVEANSEEEALDRAVSIPLDDWDDSYAYDNFTAEPYIEPKDLGL